MFNLKISAQPGKPSSLRGGETVARSRSLSPLASPSPRNLISVIILASVVELLLLLLLEAATFYWIKLQLRAFAAVLCKVVTILCFR